MINFQNLNGEELIANGWLFETKEEADSFAATGISESTIKRLEEDVRTGDLFGSAALNEIKIKTKTGIDP